MRAKTTVSVSTAVRKRFVADCTSKLELEEWRRLERNLAQQIHKEKNEAAYRTSVLESVQQQHALLTNQQIQLPIDKPSEQWAQLTQKVCQFALKEACAMGINDNYSWAKEVTAHTRDLMNGGVVLPFGQYRGRIVLGGRIRLGILCVFSDGL